MKVQLPLEILELIFDFLTTNLFFRRRCITPWLNRPFEDRLSCLLGLPRNQDTGLADSPVGYYMTPRADRGRGVQPTGDDGCFLYRAVRIYIRIHRKWRPAFFNDDHDAVACFESHSRIRRDGAVDKFSQWSASFDVDRMIGYWYPVAGGIRATTPTALLREHCNTIDAFML